MPEQLLTTRDFWGLVSSLNITQPLEDGTRRAPERRLGTSASPKLDTIFKQSVLLG